MSRIFELVNLISRLEKTEKRYLTVGVNKLLDKDKKDNLVANLFRWLNESDLFTRISKLEKHLQGKAQDRIEQERKNFVKQWLVDSGLSKEKKLTHTINVNRLFSLTLDLLIQYNSDKPQFRIDRYIQEVRIYRDKGLYDEALKLVLKLKQEITDTDIDLLKKQEVLSIEREIRTISLRTQDDYDDIQNLHQDMLQCNEEIAKLSYALSDREYMHLQHRKPELEFNYSEFSEVTQSVIKNIKSVDQHSFQVRMHSLYTAIFYFEHAYKAEDEQGPSGSELAFAYRKKFYELFDKPVIKEQLPRQYDIAKVHYLVGCYRLGRLNEAEDLIKLEESALGFTWEGSDLKVKKEISTETEFAKLNMILLFYMTEGRFTALQAIITQTVKSLYQSRTRVNNRFQSYVMFIVSCLLMKDHARVHELIAQVKKLSRVEEIEDYILVDVLDAINQFEEGRAANPNLGGHLGDLLSRLLKEGQERKANTPIIVAYKIVRRLSDLLMEEMGTEQAKEVLAYTTRKIAYQALLDDPSVEELSKTNFSSLPLWLKIRVAELETLIDRANN